MFTIRIHGKSGQECHRVVKIIGRAAFLSGYYVQDSVVYGPEHIESQVDGFVRIDNKPIVERGFITNPDFVLVLDDDLDYKNTLKDCKDSTLIINTRMAKDKLKRFVKNVFALDADTLSKEISGKYLPSILLLGAFVKKFNKLSLKLMEKAIDIEIDDRKKENKEALHEGYKKLK
ncbi:MAG: hypothetical protein DRO96_02315 [Candidatus Aenigmatarchaeota archaeon]|nr:MAG: hypothetical protein B6U68_01875 [Candidatus Aenigmarchaeota archaeon ex4484_14]RLI96782.1 MAG: hypothetical protein DRO96_02315 [Candidatus Aenigmarchaeota archaeon]